MRPGDQLDHLYVIKLSKQAKLYTGVLGLALGALVVDRLFLGGGALSPQSAMAVALESEAPAAAQAAPGETPAAPVSQRTLARSLDSLRRQTLSLTLLLDSGRVADPVKFRRVNEWKRRPIREAEAIQGLDAGLFGGQIDWLGEVPDDEPVPEAPPEAPTVTLDDILARHRITAVVEAKSNISDSFVVVDGTRVPLGRAFDGVTVVHIDHGQATFARGEERRKVDLRKHQIGK